LTFKDPFKDSIVADKEKILDEILNRKRQIAAHTKYISLPNKGDSMNLRLFAELPTPDEEVDGKYGKRKKFTWTVVDLDLLGKNEDIENIPKQTFDVGIKTHRLWTKATEGDNRCFKVVREGEGVDTKYVPYPLE
jgi:hypothetical protein